MPKDSRTTRGPMFKMPTANFVILWKNNVDKKAGWDAFVDHCAKAFLTETSNSSFIAAQDSDRASWTDDDIHNLIGERCYVKCINIQKKLKSKDKHFPLPNAYKDRRSITKKSSKTSIENIIEMLGL